MKVLKLEEELHNSVMVLEVAGLQYFSLKRLTKLNIDERPSVARVTYVIVISAVFLSMVVFGLAQSNNISKKVEKTSPTHNILMAAASSLQWWGRIINFVLTVVHSYITSRKVKKFFLNSREVIQLLIQEFNHVMDLDQINNSAWKRFGIMTFVTCFCFFFFLYDQRDLSSFAMIVFVTLPTHVFILITVYKFLFFVDLVNQQMKDLNFVLVKLIPREDSKITSEMRLTNGLLTKLKTARRIFSLIHKNGVLVNTTNGVPILIDVILLILVLLLRGYEMFLIRMGTLPIQLFMKTACSITFSGGVIVSAAFYGQKPLSLVST